MSYAIFAVSIMAQKCIWIECVVMMNFALSQNFLASMPTVLALIERIKAFELSETFTHS